MINFFSKNKLGILSLTIGILFVFIGINRNEVMTVLMKSIAICLECIGIG